LTGPILTVAIAANSVSDVLSSCSQPGMPALSVAGSLSFSQTVCGGTGSSYSPFMVIAIVRAPCAGLTNYSLVSHPIAYRLAQRLKRVLGRRLHEHWEDRMPEVKTDDGCIIHVKVEGPQTGTVLMLSNSLGTAPAGNGGSMRAPAHPTYATLRSPRPWQVERAERSLSDGTAGPRRACHAG